MRRKQTSIHFSRSVPTHRYLRSISWISWVRRPQAAKVSTLYKLGFHPEPQSAHMSFSWRSPRPKAAIATLHLCFRWEDKANIPPIFPREKEEHLSSLSPPQSSHPTFLSYCYVRGPSRAASDPSAAGPSPLLCGLPTNKKMRARGIAPRTRSKKRRLLAQENTRRHAWLIRSCFGRKNLFIDGPRSLLSFFLSPFLQRKRKKKTEANSAGSNTSLGLTSFVLTMYAIGPSRLVR